MKNQKDEIFEEDDGDNDKQFNEMRETKTGFGAKGGYHAEGGLEPGEDEDSDEEDDDDVDGDIGDDPEDDDDDESDHNF